jgi:hypothetical protein
LSRVLAAVALVAALAAPVRGTGSPQIGPGHQLEVVATGLLRPVQLAFDPGGRLVVLSHGRRDDDAAEVLWLDLRSGLPVDASISPRVVIPFPEQRRKNVFGSLAAAPDSDDLYLGEENGNRVYRLSGDNRLVAVAVGLNHLVGGSGIATDGRGRLIVLDFASADTQLRSESRPPPGLDTLVTESYQGPLIFRVDFRERSVLPRRLDLLPPLYPRGWKRPGGEPPRFVSVAAAPGDGLVLLDSLGQVFRLSAGDLQQVSRLPSGHYHRTNLAVAADGTIYVSSGFHIRRIYRITAAGAVSVVASDLGDPAGIVVDAQGWLYVAESTFHRVIRIRRSDVAPATPPPPSPR